jgi:hypothetical protein
MTVEYTDRYGGPENWPDPATVCTGPCEGMGVYPQPKTMTQPDGVIEWEFVQCSDCGGTGLRP